jgi:hypothetical protein
MSELKDGLQFTVAQVLTRTYYSSMVGGQDDRQPQDSRRCRDDCAAPLRVGGMLMWGGLKVANFGRGLLLHKDPAA